MKSLIKIFFALLVGLLPICSFAADALNLPASAKRCVLRVQDSWTVPTVGDADVWDRAPALSLSADGIKYAIREEDPVEGDLVYYEIRPTTGVLIPTDGDYPPYFETSEFRGVAKSTDQLSLVQEKGIRHWISHSRVLGMSRGALVVGGWWDFPIVGAGPASYRSPKPDDVQGLLPVEEYPDRLTAPTVTALHGYVAPVYRMADDMQPSGTKFHFYVSEVCLDGWCGQKSWQCEVKSLAYGDTVAITGGRTRGRAQRLDVRIQAVLPLDDGRMARSVETALEIIR